MKPGYLWQIGCLSREPEVEVDCVELSALWGFPLQKVFQPPVGEDLYVSLQDLKDYCDGLENFWQELSEAMQQ